MINERKFNIWVSGADAKAAGFTHHARMFGIIPGFYSEDGLFHRPIWCSRSDLLNPVEDGLSWLFGMIAQYKGVEHTASFNIGAEIRT